METDPVARVPIGRALLFFVVATLLLTGATADVFRVTDAGRLIWHPVPGRTQMMRNAVDRTAWYAPTAHEQGLVRDSIDACVRLGPFHSGGFPTYLGGPYYSAVGLYNLLWGRLAPRDPERLSVYFEFLERLMALLAALAIAFLAVWAWPRLGFGAAVTLVAFCAVCLFHLQFARSLYWHWFLAISPYVFVWTFGERLEGRRRLLLGGVALLVFLKALMSYEYLTNIVLAACLPTVFFELKSGFRFRRLLRRGVAIGLAGVAGFGAALLCNYALIVRHVGGFEQAWAVLEGRAGVRTLGEKAGFSYWADGTSPFRMLREAAESDMIVVHPFLREPLRLTTDHLILAFGAIAALYLVFTVTRLARRDPVFERLAVTTAVALAFVPSWALLAPNHLRPHVHLSPILYFLPFLPTLALTVGRFLEWAFGSRSGLIRAPSLPNAGAGTAA